jgi:transcriptional regulator with XRE-family HTH domain
MSETDNKGNTPVNDIDTSYIQIKNIRKKKGMTLKEFAKLSGLSISFLSNFENGKVNISVSTLKKISAALNVSIAQLLSDENSAEVILVHKKDRHILPHHMTKSGMAYTDYLVRGASAAMHVTITRLPAHSDTGNSTIHTGEEYIFVLHGVATVVINENRYLLQEGDIIYYLSQSPHKVTNDQDGELEYLQTNTPPTF